MINTSATLSVRFKLIFFLLALASVLPGIRWHKAGALASLDAIHLTMLPECGAVSPECFRGF
jgi:hypothetical protein